MVVQWGGPAPAETLLTRREMLHTLAAAPLVQALGVETTPSPADRAFLEELQHRSFLYFWEQANPQTGLVPDRSSVTGGPPAGPSLHIGSSAATGFGLSALCIGTEHKWITQQQAEARVLATLDFFANHAFQQNGWFYHWMDTRSGERMWNSEVSSIDTALLLGGVLCVAQYFAKNRKIAELAKLLYERIDFPWMLNGDKFLLSHGWRPDKGFIKFRWGTYAEMSMLYLMAIGSPTHPITAESWYAWNRPLYNYGPYQFISGGPLFTHQYSHAWVDFKGRRDRGFIDFFDNSVQATRANRLFCINEAKSFPKSFQNDIWGVTASDSAKGYKIYSEIAHFTPVDGTVAPCGPGGSLMLTPDICVPALKSMHERFADRVYGKYGFVDAFNPQLNWFDTDVIGIDVGITLLSAENLLTGKVWHWFMQNKAIPLAMNLAGFEPAFDLTPPKAKAPVRRRRTVKTKPTKR